MSGSGLLVVTLAAGLFLAVPGYGPAQGREEEIALPIAEAREALARGDLAPARERLETVLALDPAHPEALELLRMLEEAAGGGAPTRPAGWQGLGGDLPAGLSPEEGLPRVSPEVASELLAEDPEREDAAELRGIVAQKLLEDGKSAEAAGKGAKAMVAFRKAAFMDPADPLIRYEYFQALFRRNRLPEALEQAEAFLRIQSQGALASEMRRQLMDVYTRLAERDMKESDWTGAVRHLAAVRSLGPEGGGFGDVDGRLAVCYYSLGAREAAQGRRAEACRAFSSLLSLRPGNDTGRDLFDRQYLDRLRSTALSGFWNQAKEDKAAGRLLEAFRYFGHVLLLGSQNWMLKLARQARDEIRALAGDAVQVIEAEEAQLGLVPVASAPAPLRPGSGIQVPPAPAAVPPPEVSLEAALYGAPVSPDLPPGPVAGAALPMAGPATPAAPWVPGSGELPRWLEPGAVPEGDGVPPSLAEPGEGPEEEGYEGEGEEGEVPGEPGTQGATGHAGPGRAAPPVGRGGGPERVPAPIYGGLGYGAYGRP